MDRKNVEAMLAIEVRILGRPYKVACKESEREALLSAVTLLDESMKKIHESNKTISIERVAVIAALNFANDLLQMRRDLEAALVQAQGVGDVNQVHERLQAMEQSIDRVLSQN